MKGVLVALGLTLCASEGAVALDLKRAKFPIEYECRMTKSGGIRLDKTGRWQSGAFTPDSTAYRYSVERLAEMKNSERKDSCNNSRLTSPQGSRSSKDSYCLTSFVGVEGLSMTKFCSITYKSARESNAVLTCEGGSFLDTDRGVLIKTDSLVAFEYELEEPTATIDKHDCIRLDR